MYVNMCVCVWLFAPVPTYFHGTCDERYIIGGLLMDAVLRVADTCDEN